MRAINLTAQSLVNGGMLNPFQVQACLSTQRVWQDGFLTCQSMQEMLASLKQNRVLPDAWIANIQHSLPPHLQFCPSWEAYLEANPGYPESCI